MPALIIAIVITAIIWYFYSANDVYERETARVTRVLDGDTFDLEDGRRVRLLNVNTPEKNEPFHELGQNYLEGFINKTIEIEITGVEKYGRMLGRAYGPEYINLHLVREGYATSFLVDESEVKVFSTAQEEAFKEGKGIWNKSEEYRCLTGEINKKEEYVDFSADCLDIKGWTVKDESTKKYSFSRNINGEFRLYSRKGTDNEKEVYWGVGNVWNDDRDSIFVRDNFGNLVYYYSYGY